MDDFCDIKMFKSFNINNLWMNVDALNKKKEINLDLIINPKVIEGKKII